jgi:hypothetical protein
MKPENIKLLAWNFTLAAIVLFIVAVLVAVAGVIKSAADEDATGRYLVAAVFAGAALWLFLIAQVIYIRANTEK